MKLLKPNSYKDEQLVGSHCGDTFRELVDLWQEAGYCTVEESPNDFVWVNEVGSIILYDYPRIDDRQIPHFQYGLFGNHVPNHDRCLPWTFWARAPRLLESCRNSGIKSYEERNIESIFLGKIENSIQDDNRRNQDWSSAEVELFNCPVDKPGPDYYMYSQKEYLDLVGSSKFGLCLAGYGPKCNREIELIGMGTVPVFAPEVDNTYHEPLIEGVHFIRIQSPDQFKPVISSITQEQWQKMHDAGQDWYARNASVEGSFNLTKSIVDKIK
jgi:hypothetical protein